MKKLTFFTILVVLLSACAPSAEAVQTAIAQTQAANPTPTDTATYTPSPTPTRTMTRTPRPTNTPRPTRTPKAGTVDYPFPYNQVIDLTLTKSGKVSEFSLQVLEVIRGAEALSIVKRANMFNDDPPEGMEYALVKIGMVLQSGNVGFDDRDFVVASKGRLFDGFSFSVCCTDDIGYPEFEADLILPDASAEGWIIRIVYIDDDNPLLVLGVGYDNDISGALFFSTAP